jgi:hypothetical protein
MTTGGGLEELGTRLQELVYGSRVADSTILEAKMVSSYARK